MWVTWSQVWLSASEASNVRSHRVESAKRIVCTEVRIHTAGSVDAGSNLGCTGTCKRRVPDTRQYTRDVLLHVGPAVASCGVDNLRSRRGATTQHELTT